MIIESTDLQPRSRQGVSVYKCFVVVIFSQQRYQPNDVHAVVFLYVACTRYERKSIFLKWPPQCLMLLISCLRETQSNSFSLESVQHINERQIA